MTNDDFLEDFVIIDDYEGEEVNMDGWKTNQIYAKSLINGVDIHNRTDIVNPMVIFQNDNYGYYHNHKELKNELKRIFDYLLTQYNRHGEFNLLELCSFDFNNDLHFVVHDLFVDLWEDTNRFSWYDMMTEKSSGRSDNIRLIAKGVFDKLWEKHKSA